MTARRVRSGLRTWSGPLWLSGGRALYVGPAFDTGMHAHHAVQVSIAALVANQATYMITPQKVKAKC